MLPPEKQTLKLPSRVFGALCGTLKEPVKRDAVPLFVAALILGIIGFTAHKIYEHHVTGGAGFVNATEMVDLDALGIDRKKRAFFDTLRPVIEAENARVLKIRRDITTARNADTEPGWLHSTADDFGMEWTGQEWDALLRRVDAVPMTLVMAQAANESNWGQSRFAQQGNNLFGQWCFTPGCGIVPEKRPEGARHEVRSFASVNDSVRSYLHNINTHRAYRDLRRIRAQDRAEGRVATGTQLAGGLNSYSERGEAYVNEIRSTIRVNRSLMLGEGRGDR